MKKKDFLAMIESQLSSLGDDDHVLVACDGGEYWGAYDADLKIEVEQVVFPDQGVWVGHPGGRARIEHVRMVARIKEA